MIRPDALLIGIGNSGRQDDGLGWAFLDALKETGQFPGQINYCYQLQVEDADLISQASQVIFIDAFKGKLKNGFQWHVCRASGDFAFTTHALSPEAILFLCQDLYQKDPPTYVLQIEGENWELKTGLTPKARENLKVALNFFVEQLSAMPAEVRQ